MLTTKQSQELARLLWLMWPRNDRQVEYCLKSTKYIELNGAFVNCGDLKPTIASDLWYDDETDGPDASKFEAFREYNLRTHKLSMLSTSTQFGSPRQIVLTPNYYGDKTGNRLLCPKICQLDEPLRFGESVATPAELRAINAARAEVNADYEKRLAAYWKRYSSKVHARGYYANR